MIQYFIGILIILAIYGIVISRVDSGRCFRYEYIIKTIIISGIYILWFGIGIFIIHFRVFLIPQFFFMLNILVLPIIVFHDLKYTIQRFYDLNLSGWYILLKLIPILYIFVTLYLFIKKGNRQLNDYDKAINYKKLFKNRHCINISEKTLVFDEEEYQYECYMDRITIKISKYKKDNVFTEYLFTNYQVKETGIYKEIEFPKEELNIIISALNLVVISNSFYVKIKDYEVFIRKEDFRYTIVLEKDENKLTKELYDTFDFPGTYYEDEQYIYYNKIYKGDLQLWAKNVA